MAREGDWILLSTAVVRMGELNPTIGHILVSRTAIWKKRSSQIV
jgi:hypothetical protein